MIDYGALSKQIPADFIRPTPVEIQEVQEEGIRIQYRYQSAQVPERQGRFWGGVRVFYGQTILECEELTVDYNSKTGRATGKVRVTDPEGEMNAPSLEFNWQARTGSAESVEMRVAGMRLNIDRLEVEPAQWIAVGVKGTPSKVRRPDFEFTAERLLLKPGKSGRAEKPGVSLFGTRLGTIPRLDFALGRQVLGVKLPTIGYRQGEGFGTSWGHFYELNSKLALSGRFSAYPDSKPSYQLEFAGTPMNGDDLMGGRSPRNDLGARFADSWIDTVFVQDRTREIDLAKSPRVVYSVGSYWGQTAEGRLEESRRINKPVDAALEFGGPIKDWGALIQLRGQRLRGRPEEPYLNRGQLYVLLTGELWRIGSQLALVGRLDSASNTGSGNSFGWLRGAAYVVATPDPKFTLALGSVWGGEDGRADFGWDRLASHRALHARADVKLGAFSLSGMAKYDLDRERWVDTEYYISVVAGSFEPFFAYRQFPKDIQFGARLRLDEFFELLSRRSFRNEKGAGTKPAP